MTSKKLFVDGKVEPMWRRAPQPTKLPNWITREEVDYFVKEFERAGWNGGLNWYRVMNLTHEITPQLTEAKVPQPVTFIAGTKDNVIQMSGGLEKVKANLEKGCCAFICAVPY